MASFMGFAQQPVQPCNTYAAMDEFFAANPSAKKAYEAAQEQLKASAQAKLINNNEQLLSAPPVYTIPVVFHILHEGGSENVSDQVCINALKAVNDDFAKLGSDANTIAAPFQPLFIDSEMRFRLAKKDPNGNCTTGIVHHYDTRTNWNQGGGSANYTGLTWDPQKYMNIIIVKQIIPTGTVTGGGIIVGYTYKPGTPVPSSWDAIVYNYSYLTGQSNLRSLTHEIGHWFNLPHTFGNTNNPGVTCGDDGISDTPPTKGAFSTCPSSLSGNTCDASGQDNVENIMNYSSCPKNFTSGQTTVMRTAAASPVNGRNNLSSTGNLTATDVNGTASCAPVAEFLSASGTYTVCSGATLTFKDFSYNGTITTYAWSGDNGTTFGTPSATQCVVTFPTPGITTVSLTVSNAQGTSVKTRTVSVLNGAVGISMPYVEGFEAGSLPTNWSINNLNPGSVTWEIANVSEGVGSKSYFIDGTQATFGQIDQLVSPVMDLVNHPLDTFTFKFAYARKNSTHNDVFKVEASKDCGGAWYTIYNPSAASMANGSGGTTSSPFSPTLSQWKHVKLNDWPNWNTVSNGASVIFRFSFQEDPNFSNGNNFFLDNINFSGDANGINELTKMFKFNLYPNPSKGEATIKFNLHDAANVKIDVIDVLGKKVLPTADLNMAPGEQTYSINKNNSLNKGIYFVNLSINGAKMSKKLVIE
jgi:PKD repeat protein